MKDESFYEFKKRLNEFMKSNPLKVSKTTNISLSFQFPELKMGRGWRSITLMFALFLLCPVHSFFCPGFFFLGRIQAELHATTCYAVKFPTFMEIRG